MRASQDPVSDCEVSPCSSVDISPVTAAPGVGSSKLTSNINTTNSAVTGLTPELPERFLSPAFVATIHPTKNNPAAAFALLSQQHCGASTAFTPAPPASPVATTTTQAASTAMATPCTSMRELSNRSNAATASVRSALEAPVDMTPRTMVKQFIAGGLRSSDLHAETPATRRRQQMQKQQAMAKKRQQQQEARTKSTTENVRQTNASSTVFTWLLQVLVLVLVFVLVLATVLHLLAPVRDFVQNTLYGGSHRNVRFT